MVIWFSSNPAQHAHFVPQSSPAGVMGSYQMKALSPQHYYSSFLGMRNEHALVNTQQLLVGLNRLGAFTLKKCPSREKFKLCPRWRAPNKMLPWFLVLERLFLNPWPQHMIISFIRGSLIHKKPNPTPKCIWDVAFKNKGREIQARQ